MSGVFDDNIPKGRGDSSQYQNLVGMDWRGTDNPNSGSIQTERGHILLLLLESFGENEKRYL